MAAIRVIIRVVIALLLVVLGELGIGHVIPEVRSAWRAFALVFLYTAIFDRTRGGWLTWVLTAVTFFLAAGVHLHEQTHHLAWVAVALISLVNVVVASQVGLPRGIKIGALAFLAISGGLLPFLESKLFLPDATALGVIAIAGIQALVPAIVQYTKISRPAVVWRLVELQQTFLRLAIIVWAFSFKPVLIDTNLQEHGTPLLVSIALLTVVLTNIRVEKIVWLYTSSTFISLLIFTLALTRNAEMLPLLLVITAMRGAASLTPVEDPAPLKQLWPDASALELGGLGGPGFVVAAFAILRARPHMGQEWFYILAALFLFLGAKVWTQSARQPVWGATEGEPGKLWYLARGGIDAGLFIFSISLLFAEWRFSFA